MTIKGKTVPKIATKAAPTSAAGNDGSHKAELLAGVMQLLARNAPEAKSFASLFFARGSLEDLSAYSAGDLARFAEDSYRHVQKRKPGELSLRVESEPENRITIVEMINDNMPFLFDSVMATLNELGHEIRLVLHPILTVSRDK